MHIDIVTGNKGRKLLYLSRPLVRNNKADDGLQPRGSKFINGNSCVNLARITNKFQYLKKHKMQNRNRI